MDNLVQHETDASGPNCSLGTFSKTNIFMYAEINWFRWEGAIFHCKSQVNSDSAVAVGRDNCVGLLIAL